MGLVLKHNIVNIKSKSISVQQAKSTKLQRYCFQFPSSYMKNYSKIVANYSNFATILQQMWDSNVQLSRFEYPLVVQVNSEKKFVYFLCKEQERGCKFFIKMRQQSSKLNEPCATSKLAHEKSKLSQFLDIKNLQNDEITYFRTLIFKNQHNHSTMTLKTQSNSSNLGQSKNKYIMDRHNFSNISNHYRRISQNQYKKTNKLKDPYQTNHINRKLNFQKYNQRALRSEHNFNESIQNTNIVQQINGKLNNLQKQIKKQQNQAENFKKQLFGQKVVFICQYIKQFKEQKQQNLLSNQQKIYNQALINSQQEKSTDNSLLNVQKEYHKNLIQPLPQFEQQLQSQGSINGQPCVYFYSSFQMQKNLALFPQVINIIVIQNYTIQQSPFNKKVTKNINYTYIFCGVNSNKQCMIFAVAFVCTSQCLKQIKQSIIYKFLNLPETKRIQTIIINHGNFELMEIVENAIAKKQQFQKIRCLFKIQFGCDLEDAIMKSETNQKFNSYYKCYKNYNGQDCFVEEFTKSLFQYFYEKGKQYEKSKALKNKQDTQIIDQQQQIPKASTYPLSDLYFPTLIRIEHLLKKMCLTPDANIFYKLLLKFISNFCYSDYHFMLLHSQVLKYKDKIFLSQMKKKSFVGFNLLVQLQVCVSEYINLKSLGQNLSYQKMFKLLITKANQNSCMFQIPNKYWGNILQQVTTQQLCEKNQTKTPNNITQLNKKKNQNSSKYFYEIQGSKRKAAQVYILKKHPYFKILQSCLNNSAKHFSKTLQAPLYHKSIMKRLPFYNQTTLYMSQESRQILFNKQIISMLQYSWIDLSDRTVVGITSKAESNIDVNFLVWNENQMWWVKRGKQNGGFWQCDCGISQLIRMPCRHILKAMMKYQCNMIASVGDYWYKK